MSYLRNAHRFNWSVIEFCLLLVFQEQSNTLIKTKLMTSNPKSKSRPLGAKLPVQTSRKNSFISVPRLGHSPPNRDPGPAQVEEIKKGSLSQELQKMQNELDVYIQKVEELANRGKSQILFFGTSASSNDHSFSVNLLLVLKQLQSQRNRWTLKSSKNWKHADRSRQPTQHALSMCSS